MASPCFYQIVELAGNRNRIADLSAHPQFRDARPRVTPRDSWRDRSFRGGCGLRRHANRPAAAAAVGLWTKSTSVAKFPAPTRSRPIATARVRDRAEADRLLVDRGGLGKEAFVRRPSARRTGARRPCRSDRRGRRRHRACWRSRGSRPRDWPRQPARTRQSPRQRRFSHQLLGIARSAAADRWTLLMDRVSGDALIATGQMLSNSVGGRNERR